MVQLIIGQKGKGKTKYILDKVNSTIKVATGSIVYLDKSSKHMLELNNKIRLIDCSAFPLKNSDEFIGFICGIISQNRDIEQMYHYRRQPRYRCGGGEAVRTARSPGLLPL